MTYTMTESWWVPVAGHKARLEEMLGETARFNWWAESSFHVTPEEDGTALIVWREGRSAPLCGLKLGRDGVWTVYADDRGVWDTYTDPDNGRFDYYSLPDVYTAVRSLMWTGHPRFED